MYAPAVGPYECNYPDCHGHTSQGFRSPQGLKSHKTLWSHHRVRDAVEAGDGDAERPPPAHPGIRRRLEEQQAVSTR